MEIDNFVQQLKSNPNEIICTSELKIHGYLRKFLQTDSPFKITDIPVNEILQTYDSVYLFLNEKQFIPVESKWNWELKNDFFKKIIDNIYSFVYSEIKENKKDDSSNIDLETKKAKENLRKMQESFFTSVKRFQNLMAMFLTCENNLKLQKESTLENKYYSIISYVNFICEEIIKTAYKSDEIEMTLYIQKIINIALAFFHLGMLGGVAILATILDLIYIHFLNWLKQNKYSLIHRKHSLVNYTSAMRAGNYKVAARNAMNYKFHFKVYIAKLLKCNTSNGSEQIDAVCNLINEILPIDEKTYRQFYDATESETTIPSLFDLENYKIDNIKFISKLTSNLNFMNHVLKEMNTLVNEIDPKQMIEAENEETKQEEKMETENEEESMENEEEMDLMTNYENIICK